MYSVRSYTYRSDQTFLHLYLLPMSADDRYGIRLIQLQTSDKGRLIVSALVAYLISPTIVPRLMIYRVQKSLRASLVPFPVSTR